MSARWHADLPLMVHRWRTARLIGRSRYNWGLWSPFWKHEVERTEGHGGHAVTVVPVTPDVERQKVMAFYATLSGEWPKHDDPFGRRGVTMYPPIRGYGWFFKHRPFGHRGGGRRRSSRCRRDESSPTVYVRGRERRALRRELNAA